MLPGICVSCEGKLGAGAKMADSCPIFFQVLKKSCHYLLGPGCPWPLKCTPPPYRSADSSVMPLCVNAVKGIGAAI